MPTESAFLLAGLLFIAAALGYVFARFGETDDEDEQERPDQLSSDYLKGLNYVLNEQPDRAVEVFTRMAELDDEALETHFALGGLFRKRGEVDRAIRVHQNLMARPSLSASHRDQAEDALAEDYLSAGLFDRAEALFVKLSESDTFRVKALQRLVRIYEVTQEWDRAIEIQADLVRAQKGAGNKAEAGAQLAHYYCELADQAREQQDIVRAREMLRKADHCRDKTVRSVLARADLDRDMGQFKDAARLYQKAVEKAPNLLVDVLPQLVATCQELDNEKRLADYLHKLIDAGDDHVAAIAMAAVRNPQLNHPVVLDALLRFMASDRTLGQLIGIDRIEQLPEPQRVAILDDVRAALRSILAMKPGYHCTECGYACLGLQWQCPGCRAWETVVPEVRIRLT